MPKRRAYRKARGAAASSSPPPPIRVQEELPIEVESSYQTMMTVPSIFDLI